MINKTIYKGEDIFLDNAIKSLNIIEEYADKINIKGVALVAFISDENPDTWISRMKVIGNLTKDEKNFLSIAYTKAGEMVDTLKDSGTTSRKPMLGEFGFLGGVIKKVNYGYALAAFSGASGEEDAQAAKTGLDFLIKVFNMRENSSTP